MPFPPHLRFGLQARAATGLRIIGDNCACGDKVEPLVARYGLSGGVRYPILKDTSEGQVEGKGSKYWDWFGSNLAVAPVPKTNVAHRLGVYGVEVAVDLADPLFTKLPGKVGSKVNNGMPVPEWASKNLAVPPIVLRPIRCQLCLGTFVPDFLRVRA